MIARTLSRRVALQTADAGMFQALRYLECDPDIPGRAIEESAISIDRHRSYYRLVRDGEVVGEQIAPRAVVDSLHALLFILSLKDFPDAPIIHAASLRRAGRRVLLVGPKGGGKTTLALRLLLEGFEVEGDEHVFVTDEGLIARPRGLRVKPGTASIVPGLDRVLAQAGLYRDEHRQYLYNLDPRQAGAASWRIEQGIADAVVLLRPNHGGYSSLRPISSLALMRETIAECGLAAAGRGKAIAVLSKFIGGAKGFDLSHGKLDQAVACMDTVFQELG